MSRILPNPKNVRKAFISTTDAFYPVISPNPQAYDLHVYQTPSTFLFHGAHVPIFHALTRLVCPELLLLRRLRGIYLLLLLITLLIAAL